MDSIDTAEIAPVEYTVPAHTLPAIRKELAAQHRKAARAGRGGDAPELEVIREEWRRRCASGCGYKTHTICGECGDSTYPAQVAIVRLVVAAPVVAGWEFLAAIEPLGAGNLIRRMPGAAPDVSLEAYRDAAIAQRCEHCQTSRRRALTFVLRELATGRLLQVGRSCLQAFLGEDPADILLRLRWADLLRDADSDDCWGAGSGAQVRGVPTIEYLEHVAATIRVDGWRPRAHDCPTAVLASRLAWPSAGGGAEERAWRQERRPTEADRELAAAALVAGQGLPVIGYEFESNLRLVACADVVIYRTTGLAAALVQREWRRREAERTAAAAAPAPGRQPQHVGTVGERLRDLPVTVVSGRVIDGQYPSTLLKLVTADGDTLAWFASGELLISDYEGKRAKLTATVKDHGEFRGVPETRITRAKLALEVAA